MIVFKFYNKLLSSQPYNRAFLKDVSKIVMKIVNVINTKLWPFDISPEGEEFFVLPNWDS